MTENKLSSRQAAKVGAGALAIALLTGVLPTALAEPAAAATPSAYVDSKGEPVMVEDLREAGNATVEFLYKGAEVGVPRPANRDIWPSGDVYDSLNIQPVKDATQGKVGECAITMMGQSQGLPLAKISNTATPNYADVTRNFAQTTPLVSSKRLDQDPHFENGYQITRPATDADASDTLTESGRVKVTGTDAGYLTLAMDGWSNTIGVERPGDFMQHSRLRIATGEVVNDFRLVMRLDSVTEVSKSITTMANWNGWWAPGYTQAPSDKFSVTYEESEGVTYAIVTASEVPANTWATITFQGLVKVEDYEIGGQLFSWSAATASFPGLRCEMPTPRWDETSHFPGSSVILPNLGDAIPQGTSPVETKVVARNIDFATTSGTASRPVSVDAKTGELTSEIPADAVPGRYTVPVTITYGDGTSQDVEVVVNVLPLGTYLDTAVNQGETATVATPLDQAGKPMPEGATYAPGDNLPDWATVNVDGTITVSPGVTIPAADYEIPVVATLPGGESRTIIAKITVVNPNAPAYENGTVNQGGTIMIPAPTNEDSSALPEGTSFTPGDNVPDWVTLNEDGTLTVSPGASVAPGKYSINIVVAYPDGTNETLTSVITVVAVTAPETNTPESSNPSGSAPADRTDGSGLARTGLDGSTLGYAALAAAIALAGGAALLLGRRHRQREEN